MKITKAFLLFLLYRITSSSNKKGKIASHPRGGGNVTQSADRRTKKPGAAVTATTRLSPTCSGGCGPSEPAAAPGRARPLTRGAPPSPRPPRCARSAGPGRAAPPGPSPPGRRLCPEVVTCWPPFGSPAPRFLPGSRGSGPALPCRARGRPGPGGAGGGAFPEPQRPLPAAAPRAALRRGRARGPGWARPRRGSPAGSADPPRSTPGSAAGPGRRPRPPGEVSVSQTLVLALEWGRTGLPTQGRGPSPAAKTRAPAGRVCELPPTRSLPRGRLREPGHYQCGSQRGWSGVSTTKAHPALSSAVSSRRTGM